MPVTCLNCGNRFEGKYCSNCGQKASVQRLSASILFEETLHFLTHMESGFLHTTRSFLLKPGISSLNYIAGKRKEFQKPVSYFLIWTGLYILLHNTIINHYHYQLTRELVTDLNIREQSNILFRQHFTIFLLPVIALSSVLLYVIMAKPLYNYIEILTLSLYGAGTYFMISFISDVVLGFIFKINILSVNVFLWQGILSSIYNFWYSFDFFNRTHIRFFWIRLLLVSALIAIGGWIIMLYLPLAWLYFFG